MTRKGAGIEEQRIGIALEEAALAGVLRGGAAPVLCGANDRDDCAVLEIGGEFDLVIGSDFVRGTGFFLFSEGILSYEDVGWFLAAANISDVAAMGARQAGLVVAVRWSMDLTDDQWREIHRGISGACSAFGAPLLGGDSGSYSHQVLSAAAIGLVKKGRSLRRSNGRPGDRLFLTGTVGAAGAAVAYFTRGRHQGLLLDASTEDRLANAWRRVTPAVEQGVWIAESGAGRCAIDTSDGLKAGLLEIAKRSNVDIVVSPAAIPVDRAARTVAEGMGVGVLELAMSDSVDFRLLFTAPAGNASIVVEEFAQRGWELYEIGCLREPTGTPRVVRNSVGGEDDIPGIPWEQSDIATVDRLHRPGDGGGDGEPERG
jgi:thiamine-monophosphate kinase